MVEACIICAQIGAELCIVTDNVSSNVQQKLCSTMIRKKQVDEEKFGNYRDNRAMELYVVSRRSLRRGMRYDVGDLGDARGTFPASLSLNAPAPPPRAIASAISNITTASSARIIKSRQKPTKTIRRPPGTHFDRSSIAANSLPDLRSRPAEPDRDRPPHDATRLADFPCRGPLTPEKVTHAPTPKEMLFAWPWGTRRGEASGT